MDTIAAARAPTHAPKSSAFGGRSFSMLIVVSQNNIVHVSLIVVSSRVPVYRKCVFFKPALLVCRHWVFNEKKFAHMPLTDNVVIQNFVSILTPESSAEINYVPWADRRVISRLNKSNRRKNKKNTEELPATAKH